MSQKLEQTSFQRKRDSRYLGECTWIEDLERIQKSILVDYPSATDFELFINQDYDHSVGLYVSFERNETLSEYEYRIDYVKRTEKFERNEYERLKKKFENE